MSQPFFDLLTTLITIIYLGVHIHNIQLFFYVIPSIRKLNTRKLCHPMLNLIYTTAKNPVLYLDYITLPPQVQHLIANTTLLNQWDPCLRSFEADFELFTLGAAAALPSSERGVELSWKYLSSTWLAETNGDARPAPEAAAGRVWGVARKPLWVDEWSAGKKTQMLTTRAGVALVSCGKQNHRRCWLIVETQRADMTLQLHNYNTNLHCIINLSGLCNYAI